MLDAIIFDLDNTLLDRTRTFTTFLHKQHVRFADELVNIPVKVFVETVLKYDNNGYAAKPDMYGQACADWSIDLRDSLVNDFYEHYGYNPILNEGALELLTSLKQTYKLGLITNGKSKGQNAKIDGAGIRNYFMSVHISEAEGVAKPDPRIFERCLQRLDIPAERAVYVGDHPDKDVAGAQDAGLKAVWIRTPHYAEPAFADAVINTLADLPDVLNILDA
ncbi:MAG: HAD family hydrolase [Deinococcota bacterium]